MRLFLEEIIMTDHKLKKYELLKSSNGFFRIRALRDFNDVKAGDFGGYIESEANLSHEGNAWVADEAKATSEARVTENAKICGHAMVTGQARISGDARVGGWAHVSGNCQIAGRASVTSPRPDLGRPFSAQSKGRKTPRP
jgi:acyl-[acyl carrier protein]--UDP-N-acetylglucosamine O-acyltransferase